jgi:hypothetical protein
LALGTEARRAIYDHFNRRETVGTVVADAIAAARDMQMTEPKGIFAGAGL